MSIREISFIEQIEALRKEGSTVQADQLQAKLRPMQAEAKLILKEKKLDGSPESWKSHQVSREFIDAYKDMQQMSRQAQEKDSKARTFWQHALIGSAAIGVGILGAWKIAAAGAIVYAGYYAGKQVKNYWSSARTEAPKTDASPQGLDGIETVEDTDIESERNPIIEQIHEEPKAAVIQKSARRTPATAKINHAREPQSIDDRMKVSIKTEPSWIKKMVKYFTWSIAKEKVETTQDLMSINSTLRSAKTKASWLTGLLVLLGGAITGGILWVVFGYHEWKVANA